MVRAAGEHDAPDAGRVHVIGRAAARAQRILRGRCRGPVSRLRGGEVEGEDLATGVRQIRQRRAMRTTKRRA